MGYQLVIAEKPSLGRAIADAIPEAGTGNDPIYKGNYCITWLYGHILTLKEPEDYNPAYKDWNMEQLPLYFDDWQQKPSPDKVDKLNQIGELLKQADMVIHAGDPDDEGQFLVDEILRWFQYSGPVMRLETANTTPKELSYALQHMQPNEEREIDGWTAYARSVSDLMVGVNLTRYFTLYNGGVTLPVGRVQTPTLGLVVNRDEQIENHKKVCYYTIEGEVDCDGDNIAYSLSMAKDDPRLDDNGHLLDKTVADQIADRIRGMDLPEITISSKMEKENPKLPFNLVRLQTVCGNKWGYDPQKVMEITQNLREKHQAISYNRSDCQYLSMERYREAPQTIQSICQNLGYNVEAFDPAIQSAAFDDSKVTAHYAIIPTESNQDLSKFTEEERNVYILIANFYLIQFMPPAIKKKITMTAPVPDGTLTASCTEILDPGYRTLLSGDNEEEGKYHVLMDYEDGLYPGFVRTADSVQKETKPPARYTKTTLNLDMTRIAKYVTDPAIRQLLLDKDKDKDKSEKGSIGTTATRASIIDGLVKRGYLEEKNKKLISTPLGREFYRILPDEFKKADLTAKWWAIQEQIKTGEAPYTDLIMSVREAIQEALQGTYPKLDPQFVQKKGRTQVGICPRCGRSVVEGKNGFGCMGYKDGCKFVIWKHSKASLFKDIRLTTKMAEALLKGETIQSDKLYSEKKDTHFTAGIKLSENDDPEKGASLSLVMLESATVGVCPRCGGEVRETSKSFGCVNYKEGCKFVIWKNSKVPLFQKLTITADMAEALIAGRVLQSDKLYSQKKKKTFTGKFRLKDDPSSNYGPSLEYIPSK